ncbi:MULTISPECIES: TetR/AcrR family transcriptional regulator [Catenuloplanes]|uniref:AcrR family transcriptional regulator n=1 Tax=Catenuloplanes niger TaxID=587534 RepID=A0AAE3ZIM5_9ACTN|nr:TetR/AcrR family transcriptional regulator [Catenuloplanes niger]MDR7320632.1 AcrR family transcriptional regulator [Catenuloplanes niger]
MAFLDLQVAARLDADVVAGQHGVGESEVDRADLVEPGRLSGGVAISLDSIAKRTGVGNATLYRHFPTREDLVEEVYRDQIRPLRLEARKLLSTRTPAEALHAWMGCFARWAGERRGISEALVAMSATGRFADRPGLRRGPADPADTARRRSRRGGTARRHRSRRRRRAAAALNASRGTAGPARTGQPGFVRRRESLPRVR